MIVAYIQINEQMKTEKNLKSHENVLANILLQIVKQCWIWITFSTFCRADILVRFYDFQDYFWMFGTNLFLQAINVEH